MNERQRIAEGLLGASILDGGFAPCPGREKHSTKSGKRDFRVVLDGAPTGYCFHGSCLDEVAAFNKELRRRIWFAENGHNTAPKGHWGAGVAPAPKAEQKARPELDKYHVFEFTRGTPTIVAAWFQQRSPVDVESCDSEAFLNALYEKDERVLVFSDHRSQGCFLAWIGSGPDGRCGTYRLSQQRTVRAVASKLPAGGKDGVWFLTNPVTGKWALLNGDDPKWTRRSGVNVTAWRFFVLESDVLEASEWLKVLANLQMPIAAIYTSGGRSIHALVKAEVPSKAHWDVLRDAMRQICCPLGADPAALSAVRLSRLPGCKRGDRMQQLIYLNPNPDHKAIRLLPALR
jgi:hypothetical protein